MTLPSHRCLQLTKFFPPVHGGIESTVWELTESLGRRGWQVDVLCANTTGRTVIDHMPYQVIRAASFGRLLATSMAPALIWQLLKRRREHDVIHVHLPDPLTNLALFIARPRARLVVHWHSDIVNQKRALKLYAPLQQWLLRRADAIIVTSPPYAQSSPWLQPFLDKIHVVPSSIRDPLLNQGTALAERTASIRQRYAGKKIVFALGRMIYYKGFDVLIDAAAHLPDDVAVVIGGAGELLEPLRERVGALGLSGKVHMVGRIDDADIAAYFQAADIFCLPSLLRSEAFGLVLVEAMAHSRPIVATNIPGSGVSWVNVHEQTGLNVEPGDPSALAAALRRVLEDPALAASYGATGRRHFENRFRAEMMIDNVQNVYASVGVARPADQAHPTHAL